MKLVILAGGLGSRISEETLIKPKPMIEIGGKPILWHIMKIYSFYGINDFIICCGYKGYLIKEYFSNYFLHNSDVTFNLSENNVKFHHKRSEPWKVSLIDTGQNSETAGRLLRVRNYIDEENFCFTYGDGLSNINIKNLIDEHKISKKLVTLTAVQPPGRYGSLGFDKSDIINFVEKPSGDNAWINGGFFICNHKVFDLIDDDYSGWEKDTLPLLAQKGELNGYKHNGFWQCMDTLRDKNFLENLWQTNSAPWKTW